MLWGQRREFARNFCSTIAIFILLQHFPRYALVMSQASSGSVVPKFLEQIEKNETLTVTHKDITRYFMSILEASCLVLQASAECLSGRIYVLDMKDPIKLVDLAESLIRLSGKSPYEDIDIKFTGLRPEKSFTRSFI